MDWHNERERGRQKAADYRAGVVWAAVLNSQGGIKEEGDDEPRAVRPDEAFPSLADLFDGDGEPRDDTQALLAALAGKGARNMKGE